MKISGIQKMTLLDFPGKVACTIFLDGCNFRCPFCHNSELLENSAPEIMSEAELLSFLDKRSGLLEAVCISGGEPTLQPNLADFIKKIKALGYAVKLDTNGYTPTILKKLLDEGLVDYVAMDIKNCPSRYAETVGLPAINLSNIEASIKLLTTGSTDYEFRTTVIKEFHDEEGISQMAAWLQNIVEGKKIKQIFLQPFVDRDTVIFAGLHAPEKETLEKFAKILGEIAETAEIRARD